MKYQMRKCLACGAPVFVNDLCPTCSEKLGAVSWAIQPPKVDLKDLITSQNLLAATTITMKANVFLEKEGSGDSSPGSEYLGQFPTRVLWETDEELRLRRERESMRALTSPEAVEDKLRRFGARYNVGGPIRTVASLEDHDPCPCQSLHTRLVSASVGYDYGPEVSIHNPVSTIDVPKATKSPYTPADSPETHEKDPKNHVFDSPSPSGHQNSGFYAGCASTRHLHKSAVSWLAGYTLTGPTGYPGRITAALLAKLTSNMAYNADSTAFFLLKLPNCPDCARFLEHQLKANGYEHDPYYAVAGYPGPIDRWWCTVLPDRSLEAEW